jgi:uncharacterized SAM-binding protein YcdF (DUF218 family)
MELADFSSLVSALTDPVNVLFLALLIAVGLLWLGKWRAGRWIVTATTIVLTVLVFIPVGTLMLLPLEQRFPIPPRLPEKVDGIIVLGGAQQPRLSKAHGIAALNARAERLTTFLALARRFPSAKLIASGGAGDPKQLDVNEAETTRMFLQEQGFDPGRVLFEARSRNTYENVVFSKILAQPRAAETWLLITSAADLPRAVGVFRRQRWPVLPVPCDYNTLAPDWLPSLNLASHFEQISHGVHEWLGLAVYYFTDRSDAFFPAPDEQSVKFNTSSPNPSSDSLRTDRYHSNRFR